MFFEQYYQQDVLIYSNIEFYFNFNQKVICMLTHVLICQFICIFAIIE